MSQHNPEERREGLLHELAWLLDNPQGEAGERRLAKLTTELRKTGGAL